MTRDDLDALGVELMAADEAGDALRLAGLAWRLYSEAGIDLAEIERLHGCLRATRTLGTCPPGTGTPAGSRSG